MTHMPDRGQTSTIVQSFLHVPLQMQHIPSAKSTSMFYSSTSPNVYLDLTRLDLTTEKVNSLSMYNDSIPSATFVRWTNKKMTLLLIEVILKMLRFF